MNHHLSLSLQDKLDAFGVQTSLMRDRRGRAVIPPPEALSVTASTYFFSDSDLGEIYQAILKRRRRWRFWHYLRVALAAGFMLWTFVVMPVIAFQR